MNIPAADAPLFDGQPIFGDLPSLQITQLAQGRAQDVDAFLGLSPGTTQYGADPSGGKLWGISGALIAPSSAAVSALEATLLSFAGGTAAFGRPTGLRFPGDYVLEPHYCHFVTGEFVPSVRRNRRDRRRDVVAFLFHGPARAGDRMTQPFRSDPNREARILRERHADLVDALDLAQGVAPVYAVPRMAAQIFDGGMMPTVGNRIFLTHPVTYSGAEGEGMSQTPAVDTGTVAPVYVLASKPPQVGDVLTAYAVGGRWVSEEGGGSSSSTLICNPCNMPGQGIPKTNLTLSWTNPLSGNGSTTLVYESLGPNWVTSIGSTFCTVNGLQANLLCTGGNIELRIIYWTSGSCATGGASQYCSNQRAAPFGMTLAAGYTCMPLSLRFTLSSLGCPALVLSGYTSFTVTP